MRGSPPLGSIAISSKAIQSKDCPNCFASLEMVNGQEVCLACGPMGNAGIPKNATHDPTFSIFAVRNPVAERLRLQEVEARKQRLEAARRREERQAAAPKEDNPDASQMANGSAEAIRTVENAVREVKEQRPAPAKFDKKVRNL